MPERLSHAEIRARAEAYIDAAIAKFSGKPSAERREAAIRKVEAASRELAALAERAK